MKNVNLCYCGCGEHRGEHAEFLPGHDGRLRGILTKVEKGEAELSDIPKIAVEHREEIAFIKENADLMKLMEKAAHSHTRTAKG